jgi:hypothetical protein
MPLPSPPALGKSRTRADRNKALVIVNYRRAFPHISLHQAGRSQTVKNVADFLTTYYPGKVANVMLKRYQIKGENRSAEIAKEIEQSQTVRTSGYEDKQMLPKSEYAQKIQPWLTAKR